MMISLILRFTAFHICSATSQPNIVVIVADDLGYNDVSWHNQDILSPNLARQAEIWSDNQQPSLLRLAKEGLVLEQAYVQPICTPTRCTTFKSFQQTLKVGFDERSVSDSHRAAAQRPLARGAPRIAHINHPSAKAIQSWSVVTYLDPYFLNSPGKAISSWFVVPGCSKRKGMQLTWWGSGILVSAAKRCCPPVGWAQHAQVKCSQCQWAKPLIAHYTNGSTVKIFNYSSLRGFDTFYGYYTGSEHYFNHTRWQYHPINSRWASIGNFGIGTSIHHHHLTLGCHPHYLPSWATTYETRWTSARKFFFNFCAWSGFGGLGSQRQILCSPFCRESGGFDQAKEDILGMMMCASSLLPSDDQATGEQCSATLPIPGFPECAQPTTGQHSCQKMP